VEAPVVVDFHKVAGPLDQIDQIVLYMALAGILRRVQAHLGEQRHENVEAGVEEEVDPAVAVVVVAAAGHRTAGELEDLLVEEEVGQLVAEADNATLDGQQEEEVVVVEQVLPTGEAPCKEVEEGDEGGGDGEGDKMKPLAVEVRVATVVVVAPEMVGCGLQKSKCSPHLG
jgi:hypothetical protein